MEIKALTPNDTELWQSVSEYAENCSFGETGRYLSRRMKNNDFSDRERVFAAFEDDAVTGFCALTKTSTVFHDIYTPYIGFVFVGEPYRGRRISEKLCRFAAGHAKAFGFDKVYLYSDLINFYEKYGFIKIDEKEAPWGAKLSVYVYTL